ncbi:MAG: DUF4476 domain-containing protein [Bacteroidetes bacterium]|nr:DUF4476 domain-containing protein [Bacteroidota bacterium]
MRKMFTTALMVLSLVASANHFNSSLTVRATDHTIISVAVNQQWIGAPGTTITVDNLTPGNHWISIARYHGFYGQSMVVFSGYVFIPEMSEVRSVLTRANRLKVAEIIPIAPQPVCYNDDYGYDPNYTYSNGYGHQTNYGYNAPIIISQNDFGMLRNSIASKSFESTKLEIAKQALQRYNFNTQQVAEMMRLFTFESSKLEFAKAAYNKTVDKNRYFLINDEFTFSSSISELNRYIDNRQG